MSESESRNFRVSPAGALQNNSRYPRSSFPHVHDFDSFSGHLLADQVLRSGERRCLARWPRETKRAETRFPGIRSASSVDRILEAERRSNSATARNAVDVSSILKQTILERRAKSVVMPSNVRDLSVQGKNNLMVFGENRVARLQANNCCSSWRNPGERREDYLPRVRVAERETTLQDYQHEDADETTDMMSVLLEYWRQEAENPEAEEVSLYSQREAQLMEGKTTEEKERCYFTGEREHWSKREGKNKARREKRIIKIVLPNIKDDIC